MYAAVKQSHQGPQSSLQPGSVESSPSVPPNSQQLAEVTGQLERLRGMLLKNFPFGVNDLLQERYFVSDITSHVFSARKYKTLYLTSYPTRPPNYCCSWICKYLIYCPTRSPAECWCILQYHPTRYCLFGSLMSNEKVFIQNICISLKTWKFSTTILQVLCH